MTIKEVAQLTGLTHQAIYKRLKKQGIKINDLKDQATGQFTPDGEAIIRGLFTFSASQDMPSEHDPDPINPPDHDDATDATELRNQVAELTTEVARLTTEVEKLRNQVATLTDERDFLRVTLEREQQLHGITLTKLPTSPASLPPGDAEKGRIRGWWDRIRGRK